jgi:uncharacterized protein YyaL (SSP411 family)
MNVPAGPGLVWPPAQPKLCNSTEGRNGVALGAIASSEDTPMTASPPTPLSGNRLTAETSPYLRQHAANPVHWFAWTSEALAEAKRQDKPILLSIGYAACHWCHVMAHESFENETIAALMNTLFVNIKVDREERPDLDTLYQSALAMMGEHGGWPLTMFLTPEGEPFWGGTYFPPEPRYGRPGFEQVLRHVAALYRDDPDAITKNVGALRDGFAKLAAPNRGPGISPALLDEAASAAFRLIDPIRGGTAGAPKFPQPLLFRLLWRAYLRTRRGLFRDAVTLTLDALCQGGIYDHLGGGFARYATDPEWLVPHFEKMLYDNALLVSLLTEVWQETASPLYAARIAETVDWLLTEMAVPADDGSVAFAAALDADSEGEEGRYYVWNEAEIAAVLGDDAGLFARVYHVTPGGNWEGKSILNRNRTAGFLTEAEERRLRDARARLLAVRWQRVPPARDHKVLADWNGLMIRALAEAAPVFGRDDWLAAARSAFTFICRHLASSDGRLHHSWCDGRARHPATIEDYAEMAAAALALHQATAEPAFLAHAVAWIDIADLHYWDDETGGYWLSADDTTDIISRSKPIADNATPSGNGAMLEVLARLFHLTGDDRYRTRAEALARLFSGDNLQYLLGIPGLLTNYELLVAPMQVVILGAPEDPATTALHRAALTAAVPHRVVSVVPPGATLPASHPAHGREAIGGQPTAYVCRAFTCGLPVFAPEALRSAMAPA